MRMIITKIENRNKCTYVTGDTGIGIVRGIWHHREPPIWGEIYFFELDIEEFDRSEVTVFYEETPFTSVHYHGGKVKFVGMCENIDDIYVIRFAEDWIEMVSLKNDDYSIKKGDFVSFTLSCEYIGIYPY